MKIKLKNIFYTINKTPGERKWHCVMHGQDENTNIKSFIIYEKTPELALKKCNKLIK